VLGYVVSHPIQYQAPLFRQLARSNSLQFVALFGCEYGIVPSFDPDFERAVDFGVPLLDGYASRFLPLGNVRPRIDRFWGLRYRIARGFPRPVPDVVVLHGWRTAMMWQTAARCVIQRIPYLLRAETPQPSRRAITDNVGSPGKLVRALAVRSLIAHSSGLLALGTANERFYLSMGALPASITRVPYVVDNAAVRASALEGRLDRREIRARLGIRVDDVLLVGVGKLTPRKRALDIVSAMADLRPCPHLVWVGSGSTENELRAHAARLGLSNQVHLTGFMPSPEAWKTLGAADLFVCPSENEPWGLVINEAVAAGLPVLVSDQCGAAEDLVVAGRTGDIVVTGSIRSWVDTLGRWMARIQAGDCGDRLTMARVAEDHSIERAGAAIECAASIAISPTCGSLRPVA
jgi:glycosyltransferase involved in cell wall biosynthesis